MKRENGYLIISIVNATKAKNTLNAQRGELDEKVCKDSERKFHFSFNGLTWCSMFKFIKKCKTGFLKNITVPCLVMQSKIEHTVRWQSAQFIYDNIASEKKKLIWFEHCGHILTLDKEREAVFNEVLAFLKER